VLQVLEDQDTGSFTNDQTLSSLVEGLTILRIDQLQAVEPAVGDLAKRITSSVTITSAKSI